MLYVLDEPEHTVMLPEMLPGVAGKGVTVTARVCAVELPQLLFAVTVTFPLVELAVALIELVVEVPLQPPGKIQV